MGKKQLINARGKTGRGGWISWAIRGDFVHDPLLYHVAGTDSSVEHRHTIDVQDSTPLWSFSPVFELPPSLPHTARYTFGSIHWTESRVWIGRIFRASLMREDGLYNLQFRA